MATIDRTTILRGPAQITFDSEVFWSKGNVSVTFENSTFDKETDAFGIVGRAKTDAQIRVSFTPVGEIESAPLGKLFPYASTALGSSIYGSTDTTLEIKTLKNKLTIKNAAVTRMPSLTLGAGTTALGEVEFTGIVKNSSEPDLAASYYEYAEGTQTFGTSFDPSKIKASEYTSATFLGATHVSVDGFTIDFDLTLAPVVADAIGTVDMRLQEVGFTASWSPINYYFPTNILDNMAPIAPGSDLYTAALSITGTTGSVSFTADKATLISSDFAFGTDVNLNGPLQVSSTRDITSGAADALFAVGIV